jgi:hypothetical protein
MPVRFGATSKVTLWRPKKGSSFNHMAYGHRESGVRCPATLRETTLLGWTKAEWTYEFRAGNPPSSGGYRSPNRRFLPQSRF